jgi:glycine cleavage system H protein
MFSVIRRAITTYTPLRPKIYTDSHEWIYTYTMYKIGLSNEVVKQLGELIYIDFTKEVGDIVSKDDELVIVESMNATTYIIKAPYNCIIIENNIGLQDTGINTDTDTLKTLFISAEYEEKSWIMKIEPISI